jgi:hypothetical protein
VSNDAIVAACVQRYLVLPQFDSRLIWQWAQIARRALSLIVIVAPVDERDGIRYQVFGSWAFLPLDAMTELLLVAEVERVAIHASASHLDAQIERSIQQRFVGPLPEEAARHLAMQWGHLFGKVDIQRESLGL